MDYFEEGLEFYINEDYERALELFKTACHLGNARACFWVASMYEEGIGTEADTKKALEYHVKACEMGEPASCLWLGLIYENGVGVERNYKKALGYYKRALDLGYEDGRQFYLSLKERMT